MMAAAWRTRIVPNGDVLELARRYFTALERGVTGDDLAEFFGPEVVQEEFPNRIAPRGARRDLSVLLDGALRGQRVMASQHFEILNAIDSGAQVALEFRIPTGVRN